MFQLNLFFYNIKTNSINSVQIMVSNMDPFLTGSPSSTLLETKDCGLCYFTDVEFLTTATAINITIELDFKRNTRHSWVEIHFYRRADRKEVR